MRDELFKEDEKSFFISSSPDANLTKPFSKSQLILALEQKYKTLKKVEPAMDFEILQKTNT